MSFSTQLYEHAGQGICSFDRWAIHRENKQTLKSRGWIETIFKVAYWKSTVQNGFIFGNIQQARSYNPSIDSNCNGCHQSFQFGSTSCSKMIGFNFNSKKYFALNNISKLVVGVGVKSFVILLRGEFCWASSWSKWMVGKVRLKYSWKFGDGRAKFTFITADFDTFLLS